MAPPISSDRPVAKPIDYAPSQARTREGFEARAEWEEVAMDVQPSVGPGVAKAAGLPKGETATVSAGKGSGVRFTNTHDAYCIGATVRVGAGHVPTMKPGDQPIPIPPAQPAVVLTAVDKAELIAPGSLRVTGRLGSVCSTQPEVLARVRTLLLDRGRIPAENVDGAGVSTDAPKTPGYPGGDAATTRVERELDGDAAKAREQLRNRDGTKPDDVRSRADDAFDELDRAIEK